MGLFDLELQMYNVKLIILVNNATNCMLLPGLVALFAAGPHMYKHCKKTVPNT